MTPMEMVYNILMEDLNDYLSVDAQCAYIYKLFYKMHLNSNSEFKYNDVIQKRLDNLERSLFNFIAVSFPKSVNTENDITMITFNGGISLLFVDDVYYFKKDGKVFSIIYENHPDYNAFMYYIEEMVKENKSLCIKKN